MDGTLRPKLANHPEHMAEDETSSVVQTEPVQGGGVPPMMGNMAGSFPGFSGMVSPSGHDSSDSPGAYRRRLLISIYLSCVLNFLLLWFLLSIKLPQPGELAPKLKMEPARLVLRRPPPPPPPHKAQTFLEVEHQDLARKPENADFYAEHDNLANQSKTSPVKSPDMPKADGKNEKTPATETVLPNVKPPPPAPPAEQVVKPSENSPPSPPAQTQKQPNATPAKTGEFALLRPTPPEKPLPAVEPRPAAPSTPAAAPPAPQFTPSEREVMTSQSKLDGGVQRNGPLAFNSEKSPYASYDKKIIARIGARWHLLVGKFYGETVGEVEIEFKLLENGRVADLHVTRNTTNAILTSWCVDAIEKSAPFEPFPEFMRALSGDQRNATFTFTY